MIITRCVCGGLATSRVNEAVLHKPQDTEDLPIAASRRAFPTPPTSSSDHHPSKSISQGFLTSTRYANSLASTLLVPIEPPQPRANPRPPIEPTMNSARLFRPLTRAAFRQPAMVRPSVMARPALAASQSKKTEVAPQQMVRSFLARGVAERQMLTDSRRSSSRPCPSSSPSSSSTRPPWRLSSCQRSSTSCPSTFFLSASAFSRRVFSSASYRGWMWRDTRPMEGLCTNSQYVLVDN